MKLTRTLYGQQATIGMLFDEEGSRLCYTLELPWHDNDPQTSCIPKGVYTYIPHNSPKHPNTWEITGVPGRSDILLHNGNTELDSQGCILVGDSTGEINGLPAVLNSVKTLNMLRGILPDTGTITII